MRLLLTLRYDGTEYCGWQVQPNGVTVQQKLQDAIEAVTGVRSGVTGCSRTDAGVHADMFCCTFETGSTLRGDKLCAALNAHLPPDISVYRCEECAENFHPRYDARGKRYVYSIWNARAGNPFRSRYALHIRYPLDERRMDDAAKLFIGKHDFAAFCASGSSVTDTVRTVRECGVSRRDELVAFYVEADGFLYNMVRIMAGTLIEIGAGRRAPDTVTAALETGAREYAGMTAAAHALMLERVYYYCGT